MDLKELLAKCNATSVERALDAEDLKRCTNNLEDIPVRELERRLSAAVHSWPQVHRVRKPSSELEDEQHFAYYTDRDRPGMSDSTTSNESSTEGHSSPGDSRITPPPSDSSSSSHIHSGIQSTPPGATQLSETQSQSHLHSQAQLLLQPQLQQQQQQLQRITNAGDTESEKPVKIRKPISSPAVPVPMNSAIIGVAPSPSPLLPSGQFSSKLVPVLGPVGQSGNMAALDSKASLAQVPIQDIVDALHALCAQSPDTAVPIENIVVCLRDRMRRIPGTVNRESLLRTLFEAEQIGKTREAASRFWANPKSLAAQASPLIPISRSANGNGPWRLSEGGSAGNLSGSSGSHCKPDSSDQVSSLERLSVQSLPGTSSYPTSISSSQLLRSDQSKPTSSSTANMSTPTTTSFPGSSFGGVLQSEHTWSVPGLPLLKHFVVLSKTGRISYHPWRASASQSNPEDSEWYKTSVYTLSARIEFSASPFSVIPGASPGSVLAADVFLVHAHDFTIVDDGLSFHKEGPFVFVQRSPEIFTGELGPLSPAKFSFRHNYKDGEHPRFRLCLQFKAQGLVNGGDVQPAEWTCFSPPFLVKSKKPKRDSSGSGDSPVLSGAQFSVAAVSGVPHLKMPVARVNGGEQKRPTDDGEEGAEDPPEDREDDEEGISEKGLALTKVVQPEAKRPRSSLILPKNGSFSGPSSLGDPGTSNFFGFGNVQIPVPMNETSSSGFVTPGQTQSQAQQTQGFVRFEGRRNSGMRDAPTT
eukprot:ANDGO_02725.mRNA.1 hypothetical protein